MTNQSNKTGIPTSVIKKTKKVTPTKKPSKKPAVIEKIVTPTILPPSNDDEPDEFMGYDTIAPSSKDHKVVSPLLKSAPAIEVTDAHRHLFNKMLNSGLLDHLTEDDVDALSQAVSNREEEDAEDDETEQHGDLFVVESKDFNGLLVKEVHLPKFLKAGPRVEEKGNLYLTFSGEPEIYEQLMKVVSSTKMKPLTIGLCVPGSKPGEAKVACKIVFPQPIFMAIDFGNFARSREEARELKIEIDFTTMLVNDTEFQF